MGFLNWSRAWILVPFFLCGVLSCEEDEEATVDENCKNFCVLTRSCGVGPMPSAAPRSARPLCSLFEALASLKAPTVRV
jgi:hypothetical protein